MRRDTNSLTSTLQIISITSICWVLGILIGLTLTGLGLPLDSEYSFILLVGLLTGVFVASA